jgi:hypothetical protein
MGSLSELIIELGLNLSFFNFKRRITGLIIRHLENNNNLRNSIYKICLRSRVFNFLKVKMFFFNNTFPLLYFLIFTIRVHVSKDLKHLYPPTRTYYYANTSISYIHSNPVPYQHVYIKIIFYFF